MQYVPKESVSKMFTKLFSANELLEPDVFAALIILKAAIVNS